VYHEVASGEVTWHVWKITLDIFPYGLSVLKYKLLPVMIQEKHEH